MRASMLPSACLLSAACRAQPVFGTTQEKAAHAQPEGMSRLTGTPKRDRHCMRPCLYFMPLRITFQTKHAEHGLFWHHARRRCCACAA